MQKCQISNFTLKNYYINSLIENFLNVQNCLLRASFVWSREKHISQFRLDNRQRKI